MKTEFQQLTELIHDVQRSVKKIFDILKGQPEKKLRGLCQRVDDHGDFIEDLKKKKTARPERILLYILLALRAIDIIEKLPIIQKVFAAISGGE
jgi:hypothetical protein